MFVIFSFCRVQDQIEYHLTSMVCTKVEYFQFALLKMVALYLVGVKTVVFENGVDDLSVLAISMRYLVY